MVRIHVPQLGTKIDRIPRFEAKQPQGLGGCRGWVGALEYQPYSITVHGQWPALRKFYLKRCEDPLHRFHYIGTTQLPPLEPRALFQTEAIFYDAYSLWIKSYGLEDKIKPLMDEYANKLNDLF